MKRSLILARESLTELTGDELVVVHGAALEVPPTLNVRECFFGPHSATDCLTRAC